MPTYAYRNKDTGEEFERFESFSSKEIFLADNPHVVPLITAVNIIGGVGGIKNDGGWNETLSQIASAHPGSALDANHGSKSTSAVKTRTAVDRWRRSQPKND